MKTKETCDLCGWFQIDTEDPLYYAIKDKHEKFHSTARIQKRNTTQGVVEWK